MAGQLTGQESGLPPWHMWGSKVEFELVPGREGGSAVGGFTPRNNLVQLNRINYARPESWHWFIAGQIMRGDSSDVDRTVIAQVNIIAGVGRVSFDTGREMTISGGLVQPPAWVEFRWNIPAGLQPGLLDKKWTVEANNPAPIDGSANANICRWLPTQDLQVYCRSGINLDNTSAGLNRVTVAIYSWFAPQVHVRPDWHMENFRGGELEGT